MAEVCMRVKFMNNQTTSVMIVDDAPELRQLLAQVF